MAERDRTLAVAVAGIAATAVVGLAATTASWLSARDDRATQRVLARDTRTYDRRVSAYLDAIDFVYGQKRSFDRLLSEPTNRREVQIPYVPLPPTRLTSRLRAFGSAQAIKAFQKTITHDSLVPTVGRPGNPRVYLSGSPLVCTGTQTIRCEVDPRVNRSYKRFSAQVLRFVSIIHDEIG